MNCCCSSGENSSKIEPENLEADPSSDNQEPEILKSGRSCTDIFYIFLFIAFVITLIGLLSYCMLNGDLYRIINGYDDCGNVCGQKNIPYENIGCSGADHTDKSILLVNPSSNPDQLVFRTCVETCEGRSSYRSFFNRCLPLRENDSSRSSKLSFFSKTGISDFFQEVSEDLQNCWREILYLCLISLAFSIIIVTTMRFFVSIIVWLILIGVIASLFCGTVLIWCQYSFFKDEEDNEALASDEIISLEKRNVYLALGIIITIATICICLVVYALRKRIGLVTELFKEAGKALTALPSLFLIPFLTFIVITLLVFLWLYFALSIESSGFPQIKNNESVKYVKNSTMLFSRWYNLLAIFWMMNIIIGCQHMIVAGSVAIWFFTRNKSRLKSPIRTSTRNVVRYHLGTVFKGALLLSFINMLRVMLKSIMYLIREPENKLLVWLETGCQCCLMIFEKVLQYITRNAYIETAISGDSFCAASRKAFNLLTSNALRVFAINSVGDFVLIFAKAFIVLSTVLIGVELIQKKEGVYHNWIPLTIAGLCAYFISHCFMSIYEMTIDTIFICFCEDCERNDGINTPYYMSRGLMEYVQNSKALLQGNDNQKPTAAWTENPSLNETR